MTVSVFDIARDEAALLGHTHDHVRTLEDVLVGDIRSPIRADLARMRLHGIIREYVRLLPASTVDAVLAKHWDALEDAFVCAQTPH